MATLSIRKTLVLGLGSTGLHVAEQLAEHLTWQYGGLDRASWVRLLVLETAQPQSSLGDRVLWGGMTKAEYLPYLNSPDSAGAEFGFREWQHGPTMRDIDDPADGAGNCRMLGRLCLFHPRTYTGIHRRVAADLSFLENLTPHAIAQSLGDPGLEVKVDEGGIVVYVVGTLCGGTGSGGCADLGFLLDVWSNDSVRRQAIFTIPHPALTQSLAPRFKKNAFYALRELNHYQLTENAWSQRLPGSATPWVKTGRPYDILRVVMPGGPSQTDVANLNAMIAQYLAAAVGPAGFAIAASDVDARSLLIGGKEIGFMAPKFSTMGVAALEYPGEHLQRAATSRLLGTTFERWSRHPNDPALIRTALSGTGIADFEALLLKLQEGAETHSTVLLRDRLRTAEDGEPPKVDEIRALLRQIDQRLTAPEAGPADQPPTLAQTVQTNQTRILESVAEQVRRLVERHLLELDGGPAFLAVALRQYQTDLESWAEGAGNSLAEYRQDAQSLRDILNGKLDELDKTQKGWGFGKKEKLRQGYQELLPQLESYLSTELKAQTAQHLQRKDLARALVDQLKKQAAPLIRRLEAMQSAFTQEAAGLERQWKELAASSPSANGKVYFEAEPPAPQGTVTREYFQLLRQRRWAGEPATGWDDSQKETAALKEVLAGLEPLRQELTRDDGRSAFDERPGLRSAREMIPAEVLAVVETRARAMFSPLREQTHIAEKASDADVDTVIGASEPKLNVSAVQVSDRLAGAPGANPLLSYLAFMDTAQGSEQERPVVAKVAARVSNSMPLRRGIIDSNDPFRLLIIREKHGFTLGQMEGVVRANAYDHHALQSSEECGDFKFWHTRRDVDWVDPLVPPSQVEKVEEDWLFTLLLGRAADPSLDWLPATRGEIEAQGWYELAAGEYYVFYAPGTDATERGERLPLSFPQAVGKLLSTDYHLLRRTLAQRFARFADERGHERLVRAADQAMRSLVVFGVTELDARRAERILRRAYRRNDGLTRAFFEFRTGNLQNAAEFAHLKHMQGEPIPNRGSEVFPNDGYYCPQGHWLGGDIQRLRDAQFLCTVCNTGERYWP